MFNQYRNNRASFLGLAVTTGSVFLLLGTVMLLKENLYRYEQRFKAGQKLEIYLRDDTTPDELHALVAEIKSFNSYQSFHYRDRNEAYNQMQQSLGIQILPDNGFNPFPNALDVTFDPQFSTYQNFLTAESTLRTIRCVEEISFNRDGLVSQERVLAFFRRLSSIVGLLIYISILLICYWGVRKMALLRRQEIQVLKLFGAGWRQIGIPVVTQGSLLGGFAAVIGLSSLYAFWHLSLELPLQLVFISPAGMTTIGLAGLIAGTMAALLVARGQLK